MNQNHQALMPLLLSRLCMGADLHQNDTSLPSLCDTELETGRSTPIHLPPFPGPPAFDTAYKIPIPDSELEMSTLPR